MNKPCVRVARILLLLGCVFAFPAWPATLTVTSNADSGPSTLRNALANANDGDAIVFTLPGGSTISLSSTLVIAKNVTIDGAGVTSLTVDGVSTYKVFEVNFGVTARIANLTIAHGANAVGSAGGIENLGTLTVTGCMLSNNTGSGAGAILNQGTLTVTNNTFVGNSTPGLGGGIYVAFGTGTVTITNNTFASNYANYGGGIFFQDAGAGSTITNNLFYFNFATNYGGSAGDNSGTVVADHNLYWGNSDKGGAQGTNCNNCASNTNAIIADPLLGSLQNNSGGSQYYLQIGRAHV